MDYRIEQLRYLLREDPSSRIFYQLGELLRREGETDEAIDVLRSGLERHPRYVSAWVCLGRSHRDLGALEEARSAFQTALDFDRENPVAARLLGETAVEREDWLGAVKALKLARALAGAEDELDAQIAMVESHLDDDGRLDRPISHPRPTPPRVRCLDVVNLSADDPFSDNTEETEVLAEMDDVFATTEAADDPVPDEDVVVNEISDEDEAPFEVESTDDEIPESIPEAEVGPADEAVADETHVVEDAATAEISLPDTEENTEEEDEVAAAEPERDGEPDDISVKDASIIDESSVGAWSTSMSAAGTAGDEAWAEPSAEIVIDDLVLSDGPWTEPCAAFDAVADVSHGKADVVEAEQPREEDRAESSEGIDAEIDAGIDAEIDPRPEDVDLEPAAEIDVVEAAADVVPQIETHEFDSIEATHPIVVEKRVADAEEQALADADEELVSEEVRDDSVEAFDASALPGEDRGHDAIEVTRPIPLPDLPPKGAITPEPARLETPPSTAEAVGDDPSDDDAETTDRRHELEHGVPLPTMTLAKLALDQDDRPLAMATLESLIERDPTNTEATAMLDELSAREETFANERLRAARATTKIAALQGWLDAVRLAAERRVQ